MVYPETLIKKNVEIVFAMENAKSSEYATRISADYLAHKCSSADAIAKIKKLHDLASPSVRTISGRPNN